MTVQSIFRTVDLSTYLSPDCTPEDAQRTCDEVVDAYRTIGCVCKRQSRAEADSSTALHI